MIHIISDLKLHYLDPAEDQHNLPNDCSYIIIAGNVSRDIKRAMLYITDIAKKYPQAQLIFNFGLCDTQCIAFQTTQDVFDLRINSFKQCPENIHFPLRGGIIGDYDFLSVFGWPKFQSNEDFLASRLIHDTIIDWTEEFYIDDIKIESNYPKAWNLEFVNEQIKKEAETIKNWISEDRGLPKVLVTAQGPNSKSVIDSEKFEIFADLDLSGITCVAGGDTDYVGHYKNARLIQSPGPDRTRVFPSLA